jgi:hypothetical protein
MIFALKTYTASRGAKFILVSIVVHKIKFIRMRFKCFVVKQVGPDVSKNRPLETEHEGTTILRNVGNYLARQRSHQVPSNTIFSSSALAISNIA